MFAERVDPEMIESLRIARSDVAGDAFIKAEAGEQTKGGGKTLFAVAPLLGGRGEDGRVRDAVGEGAAGWRSGGWRRLWHRNLRVAKSWREELCLSAARLGRAMRQCEPRERQQRKTPRESSGRRE